MAGDSPEGASGTLVLFSSLFFLVLLGPPPLEAQGVLQDAVMEVALPREPGPVPIRLTYRFRSPGGGGDSDVVPLSLLTPTPTRVRGTEALGTGGSHPFPGFRELRPHYSIGQIVFSPEVTLEYSVAGGWSQDNRVTLPIPAPGWIPENPTPRTFVARVRVPAGWSVLESFPTSVTLRPPDDGGGIYEVAIQGVPSMLILRMARGPAPLVTLEGALDLFIVVVLSLMGLWGLRYLKGVGS